MLGYKTGLACLLALISPVFAAALGWIWGMFHGATPPNDAGDVCAGCGYNLYGNVSGRCPECGLTVIAEGTRPIEMHHSHLPVRSDGVRSSPSVDA